MECEHNIDKVTLRHRYCNYLTSWLVYIKSCSQDILWCPMENNLFYFVPFPFNHFPYAASIGRNGCVLLPVEQTARPDHLSFT